MKLYLSGPITGHPIEERNEFFAAAKRAAYAELRPSVVVNPREVVPSHNGPCLLGTDLLAGHSWQCWMQWSVKAMLNCNAIAMLPGWLDSKGATLEYHLAQDLQYKIVYMDAAGCFSEQ